MNCMCESCADVPVLSLLFCSRWQMIQYNEVSSQRERQSYVTASSEQNVHEHHDSCPDGTIILLCTTFVRILPAAPCWQHVSCPSETGVRKQSFESHHTVTHLCHGMWQQTSFFGVLQLVAIIMCEILLYFNKSRPGC